jgi:hypothetical protein
MREADPLADARIDVRFAGYCVHCDRIVERLPDGSCPEGHPAESVSGRIVLVDDEPVPALPRFNVAAFLLPFIWGPVHGQWVGLIFLPIYVFMDSIISTAGEGGVATGAGSVLVVAGTLAFQAFFAKRANGLAYRAVCDRQSVEEFSRGQRIWAWASVPTALALIALIVWLRIAGPVVGRG